MYWHIDTDIVSVIVICAIYVYCRKQPEQLRSRRFLYCLLTGIIVTVVDIAASVIMEVPVSRTLYHILMTLYFVSIELVIVEWCLYVLTMLYAPGSIGGKAARHSVLLVYGLYSLFVILNPWTGAIYSLGANNEYSRGPFFAAMLVLYMAYAAALFVFIIVRWKNIPKGYPGGLLLATPVIIAVGIIAQLIFPGTLLIMPTFMICLVLSFLFLQRMQFSRDSLLVADLAHEAETDPMTGLYNRAGMEAMVQKTLTDAYGQSVLVIIADIDDLKKINDTHGHSAGDRAILLFASQLKLHFRTHDTIVRYGGDEFLIFLTGSFSEEQLRNSIAELAEELCSLKIGEFDDIPIHGSVGAAYGIVGRESFEELCRNADAALYYVKNSGKGSYAFYRPHMDPDL